MTELEERLKEADAAGARSKLITTDGVFSMDGSVAKLDQICDLADRYGALVHFDDCHATGFWGKTGRGTHEHCGVIDRIDITTGTLGKALGGASGGYTSGRRELIDLLRQRSRPYLFSNSVAPPIVGGSLKALEIASRSTELRDRLMANTELFREELARRDFDLLPGEHPIIPIMLGDAVLAKRMADRLLELGIYVVGFSYPVVPMGAARIRVQMSAAHTTDDLLDASEKFAIARDGVK
jgi:glycine C-acetyltransferase